MKRVPQTTEAALEPIRPVEFYDSIFFYRGRRMGRTLKPHHVRDAAALHELGVALQKRGVQFGKMVRNGPSSEEMYERNARIIQELVEANQEPLVEDVLEYRQIDESFLGPNRIVVVATRIPMNDLQQGDKVRVQPGFTSLEQKLIRILRRYLKVCSRSRIKLTRQVAKMLPEEFADRANVRFRLYQEPWYMGLSTLDSGEKKQKAGHYRTAAYLLLLPSVPELGGADLLVIWGMGGTQTLAFAHLLRTDLAYLLDHYGFSMLEMVAPPIGDDSMHLDFVRDWEIQVLLQGVLLEPRPHKARRRKPGRPAKAKSAARSAGRPKPPRAGKRRTSGSAAARAGSGG